MKQFCSGGCGCETERMVDEKPLCVFCEDGEPCPNGRKAPEPATPLRKPSVVKSNKKEATAMSDQVCSEPGCGKKLRKDSVGGKCFKHRSNSGAESAGGGGVHGGRTRETKPRRGRPPGGKNKTASRPVNADSTVAVDLSGAQLDRIWQSLDLKMKGNLITLYFKHYE